MDEDEGHRLSDHELTAFFVRLFPQGPAGPDVLREIAPQGRENSPLLACAHPAPEQVFEERLRVHRNVARLVAARREREPEDPRLAPRPEPTIDEVRAEWEDTPVRWIEEMTLQRSFARIGTCWAAINAAGPRARFDLPSRRHSLPVTPSEAAHARA